MPEPGNYDQKIEGLQQLRGIAILLVVWAHLSLSADVLRKLHISPDFNSGWVGVELFFILSGFVIMRSLRKSRFDLKRFYIRRVFRLFPVLTLMLLLAFPTVLIMTALHPNSVMTTSSLATLLLESLYVLSGTYTLFATEHLYVFGAMWSLSIEEQFYFFLGISLVLLRISSRKDNLAELITLVVAIVFFAIQLARFFPFLEAGSSVLRFLSGGRFDFMCAGVLLEMGSSCSPEKLRGHEKRAGLGALALIAIGFFGIGFFGHPLNQHNSQFLHRAGLPFLLTLFVPAVWLIASGADISVGSKSARKLLSWLGDRSYIIYVVHFLVFMWVWALMMQMPFLWKIPNAVIQLTGTLMIGVPLVESVYRRIEQPLIRFGTRISKAKSQGRTDNQTFVPHIF